MPFPFKNINECRLTYPYAIIDKAYSSGKHDGVDLVSDGDKTIISVTEGTVIRSGTNSSWGYYVVVENEQGSIVYAHLSSRAVNVNNKVKVGSKIGVMGSTGKSTAPHLHIEWQRKYYKSGDTLDICDLLGIKNVKGKVQLKEEEKKEVRIVSDLVVNAFGKEVTVSRILDNDSNYIKFRDLEKLFDVEIGFENGVPTISSPSAFKKYVYDYIQTSGNITHKINVWELDPLLLKAGVAGCNLNTIKKDNIVNSGYLWWEDYPTNKKPYPLSHLVCNGKVLGNNVPHGEATGVIAVYMDGTVKYHSVRDITKLDVPNIHMAVAGLTIAPTVLSKEEGFYPNYMDVTRECARVVIGYNSTKNKLVVAGYDKMTTTRGRDLLTYLGCDFGITLDGGGSALMKQDGEFLLKSDGRTQFGYLYV